MDTPFLHPQAICESKEIGAGTRIWAFAHVLPGAKIGEGCNICDHVFIENDVVIGDRTTIKCGVQLWDGARIGDDVFIGPNVTFTNDKFPRSLRHQRQIPQTHIESGASIGANSTLLPDIRVGRQAMIGAGSVITRDVPAGAIVMGNPAQITGYVNSTLTTAGAGNAIDIVEPDAEQPTPILDDASLLPLPTHVDLRGTLTVTEFGQDLPFTPQRCFLVYDVPSKHVRGEHAHRVCQQFLVFVQGSASIMLDNGHVRRGVVLDSPNIGLYLPAMIWATLYRYSEDAVMLAYASEPYDSDDYIRDYNQFLRAVSPDGHSDGEQTDP